MEGLVSRPLISSDTRLISWASALLLRPSVQTVSSTLKGLFGDCCHFGLPTWEVLTSLCVWNQVLLHCSIAKLGEVSPVSEERFWHGTQNRVVLDCNYFVSGEESTLTCSLRDCRRLARLGLDLMGVFLASNVSRDTQRYWHPHAAYEVCFAPLDAHGQSVWYEFHARELHGQELRVGGGSNGSVPREAKVCLAWW